MRNHRQTPNNSGVALVTVLVITAVTLALGYAALTISLSVLQGSKAAESSVQARLNAESGLDAVFVFLQEYTSDSGAFPEQNNIFIPDVFSVTSTASPMNPILVSGADYSFKKLTVLPDEIQIQVIGHFERTAEYFTDGIISMHQNGTNTPPNDGPYSQLGRGTTTCGTLRGISSSVFIGGSYYSNNSVNLSSSSDTPFEADFFINGDLTINGQPILGDVHAAGNITVNTANSGAMGSFYSEKNIELKILWNGTVGDLHANNTVTIASNIGSHRYGNIYASQVSPGSLPRNPSTPYSFVQIPCSFPDFDAELAATLNFPGIPSVNINSGNWVASRTEITRNGQYVATPKELVMNGNTYYAIRVTGAGALGPWGENQPFKILGDTNLLLILDLVPNTQIASPSREQVFDIATTSSLTFLTKNRIVLGTSNNRTQPQTLVTNQGSPKFAVFSLYNQTGANDFAIDSVNSGGAISGIIYSPLGSVRLANNVIHGSVFTRDLVFGNDDVKIYFHETLTGLTSESSGNFEGLVFQRR